MSSEHVEVLRELRDTGDVSDWRAMESALDAAIAALSAPSEEQAQGGEAVTDEEILWDMRHIDAHLKYSEDAASMLIQGVRRVLRRVIRPTEAQPVEPCDGSAFDLAMREYEAAAIKHGRCGDNALAVDAAAEKVYALHNARTHPPSAPVGVERNGLPALMAALERADRKGYLPEALQEAWDDLDLSCVPAVYGGDAQQPAAPTWIGIDWAEGHTHPHEMSSGCHCVQCRPHERPCGCNGCRSLAGQPAAVDEAMVERIAALLHEEATDEPWAVAGVEHDGPDRDYYRTLARKVIVRADQQPEAAGEMAELVGLLVEVRSHFTRDDDLPDDLLPRIDAALAAQPGGSDNGH